MDKHTLKNIRTAKIYGNSTPITKQLNMSENDIQILHNKVTKAFPGIIPFIEENCNKEENKNG